MTDMRRIAIVVFGGVNALDAVGPAEVFSQAERKWPSNYKIELIGRQGDASSGLVLGPLIAPEKSKGPLDTLMVAGGVGVQDACQDTELVDWLRAAAGRSRRVASVCTGTFLLARAGLLDGRRVTTHWDFCEQLALRYPAITVEPDPIFIRDGDVSTSAGVTAGMDLALALVEEDLGAEAALKVARALVFFARRPGGQAQFSVQLSSQAARPGPLRELQDWIAGHLDADLSVAGMADQAHMSQRTLARTFTREIGMTPAAYVESMRVEQARTRLEAGHPLASIVRSCGFGTAETMRSAFHRRLGVSPTDYRTRFDTSSATTRLTPTVAT
jgi:transcriptional regulator GlxA family with amidase domain